MASVLNSICTSKLKKKRQRKWESRKKATRCYRFNFARQYIAKIFNTQRKLVDKLKDIGRMVSKRGDMKRY